MRISDWSSDVCSSDLLAHAEGRHPHAQAVALTLTTDVAGQAAGQPAPWFYVVETDIKPGAEADFDRWYEEGHLPGLARSEEHTSELQLLMRISYAVFRLKQNTESQIHHHPPTHDDSTHNQTIT